MKTEVNFEKGRWGPILDSEPAELLRDFLSRPDIQRDMALLADEKKPPVSRASGLCGTESFKKIVQESGCDENHFKKLSGSLVSNVMCLWGTRTPEKGGGASTGTAPSFVLALLTTSATNNDKR